jgi:hypothetical protein
MAKLVEQSLPFFKVLRDSDTFEWGPEQQEDFDTIKDYIQKTSMLACPQLDQPPILYVPATHTAVSGTHVQERETSKESKRLAYQVPIYFISNALVGCKNISQKWRKYATL